MLGTVNRSNDSNYYIYITIYWMGKVKAIGGTGLDFDNCRNADNQKISYQLVHLV
jgi:hypothetical protein